jgi:hypothetical protein
MNSRNSQCILFIFIGINAFILTGNAQNKYVSNTGSDINSGLISAPFKTIQKGIDALYPGDTLFIRGGSYHEEVIIDQKHGTLDYPFIITAFKDEKVVLDGTIPIESPWTVHSGSIYKTTIPEDIWQLFVDDRMQVIARWPNATTHPIDPFQRKPGSHQAVDGTWWSKETTWANADASGTENGIVENNTAYHDLAATGKDFTGGSVLLCVLEQGGDGNQERTIVGHSEGSNSFSHPVLYPPKPSKAYRDNGKFYLIEHLDVLDQEEEWYYIDSTNTIYLWPKNGTDPASLSIRGRNISRSIEISNSSYVKIRGLNFFASNIAVLSDHVTIEDCSFTYPDASKRLLGIYPETSSAASEEYSTYTDGFAFSLINCSIEYTEYSALRVINGDNSKIHNNLFRHLAMLGLGKNGAIEQVNTYTRNTFEIAGNRGAVKTNTDPKEDRNQSYNYFSGFGFLQVPDGASLQAATNKTPGTVRSYNWFTYALKYGSRWDGHPAGIQGTNHHQVGLMVKGTIQAKGNDHSTYNNSSFYSQEQNGIILLSDPSYGGNQLSRTYNNLADKISGHRSASVTDFPIPGSHSHNWNGYNEPGKAVQQVYDIYNHDFRPRPGSDLVDAGKIIPGYTDGYIGQAPDIGAYEFGDTTYWIPGYQAEIASHPIPLINGTSNYEFVDLMWLHAYGSTSNDVYFGQSESAVKFAGAQSAEFMGRQTNNIFYPGALSEGERYFWRIDAIVDDKAVKGDVWSFTAGIDANPPVFKAEIKIYGKNNNIISPLVDCSVNLNDRQASTNEDGIISQVMLQEGKYYLSLEKTDYSSIYDSIYISSDTLIIDTLNYIKSYTVQTNVSNLSSGEAISQALIAYQGTQKITDSDGNVNLDHLSYGKLTYTVTHNEYFELSDSLIVPGDTSILINLTPLVANISFSVSDQDGPLENAGVTFGSWETFTYSNGYAYLVNLPAREQYNYTIEKEGYEIITDSLWLELDTTVSILVSPVGIINNSSDPSNFHIYPNPATEQLNIITEEDAVLKLIAMDGKVLLEEHIFKGKNTINLSAICEGLHIVRIDSENNMIYSKLMISK